MYNKTTYCPMPFVTLTVNPGNYISRCMMSLSPMGPIESSTYSNKNFKNLRQNMLNGIWDEKGCESCFYKEQNQIKSQREKWLDREEKYLGESGIYENNLSIKRNKIYHLYMNFSNICNFKCRMCGPQFSNAWIPDWKKIGGHTPSIQPKQQVDIEKFLNEFGKDLSDLRQIWITGGEPFMDDSIFNFFQKLQNYCDVTRLNVTINTNGSKVPVDALSQLSNLNKLHVNVSVDATGEIYNYIRAYNYTFEELDTKIRQIKKLQQDNLLLTINGAYQIYNILDVETFFDWEEEILDDIGYHFLEYRVLTGPKRLQVRHAPPYIKEQAIEKVKRLIQKAPHQFYLPDLLTELQKPHDINEIRDFFNWNDNLDNARQEKELPIITEIKNYWKNI